MNPDEILKMILRILITILIGLFVVAFIVGRATAHSWYDYACCSENDCRSVEGHVTAGRQSYLLDDGRSVPYGDSRIRLSLDNEFHLCERGGKIICLYAPPTGI